MDLRSMVMQKHWSLLRPNRDVRSSFVRFERSGRISGYAHVNETSWDIREGRLVFRHADGRVTARSGELTTDPDGRVSIVMMRGDDSTARAHLLVERRRGLIDFLDCASFDEVLAQVPTHWAFDDAARMGTEGFTAPSIDAMERIEIGESTLPALAAFGVKIAGPHGRRNAVIVDKAMPKQELTIACHGHAFNAVVMDKGCRLRGSLSFEGDENLVLVGAACPQRDTKISATFRFNAAGLFLGRGGSAGGVNVWVEGPGRSVQVGDDYLHSWGVWLRTADSHALVDLDSGEVVNASRSIVIGPHVWLGQDVIVMPGAQIGGGATVGARSIVTKPLPAQCVAAGAPAKVVRRRTSWTRSAHPGPDEREALRTQSFLDASGL